MRFATLFGRCEVVIVSGDVTHDDECELEFHREFLDLLNSFINSPALVSAKINTISKKREVVEYNN